MSRIGPFIVLAMVSLLVLSAVTNGSCAAGCGKGCGAHRDRTDDEGP